MYWDTFNIIFIFTWPSMYNNHLKVKIVVFLGFVVAVGSHMFRGGKGEARGRRLAVTCKLATRWC